MDREPAGGLWYAIPYSVQSQPNRLEKALQRAHDAKLLVFPLSQMEFEGKGREVLGLWLPSSVVSDTLFRKGADAPTRG